MNERAGNPSDVKTTTTHDPLAPRPGVFKVLLGVFGLWIVGLLVLYFTTVYPQRYADGASPITQQGGP